MQLKSNNELSERDYQTLLKLFDITHGDEKEMLQGHHRALAFYSGTIIAILGGIIAIFKDLENETLGAASLILGGVLILTFSYIGFQGCSTYSRRIIESIALRAKIEDLLDFSSKERFGGKSYWEEESLILQRYFDDRKAFTSSKSFVQNFLKAGLLKVSKNYFNVLKTLGILLIFVGISYSVILILKSNYKLIYQFYQILILIIVMFFSSLVTSIIKDHGKKIKRKILGLLKYKISLKFIKRD